MREKMKYGFYTPNFGYCGKAATLVDLAVECETAGWDGFFIWDNLQYPDMEPAADPWVALSAIAVQTNSISLGPMITPLPRREVIKLAREALTLDHLSDGRLILGIGLGYDPLPEWSAFGLEEDRRVRGEMVDEGLQVIDALWSGEAVNHVGTYYKAVCEAWAKPIQQPRIPIWIAGQWPGKKPFRRAANWDGVIPIARDQMDDGKIEPADLYELLDVIRTEREPVSHYDVAIIGMNPDTLELQAYGDAGTTWWLEASGPWSKTLDEMKDQIRRGPPGA
jgi:alkanesulfonate monooxygenase SsuD/methylene tetrahydromethanopterin reductase-like flavin-dependent oxidoreductase (luciferase family)